MSTPTMFNLQENSCSLAKPQGLGDVSGNIIIDTGMAYNGNEDEEIIESELLHNETSREEAIVLSVLRYG